MPLKHLIKFNWIWFMVTITSIIAGIILFCDFDRPEHYLYLPLLPFTFALINMLAFNIFKDIHKNIGLSLVIGFYYIRIVIVPIIMSFGDYASLEKMNISQNMNWALILMIYEFIIVYITLYWSNSKKYYIENASTVKYKSVYTPRIRKLFKWILFIILLFDIFVWITIPESRNLYTNIIDNIKKTSFDIVTIDSITKRGNLKRALLTLYTLTMEIVRVLLPAYIMIVIRKKFGETIVGIIFSIPFIILQFFLVSNTHARALMSAFVLVLLLAKIYPSWSKRLYRYSFVLATFFVLFYFSYKSIISSISGSSSTLMAESASSIANAYFSGPDNVAAIFNVESEGKWATLIYTLISSIPFNGTFFGLNGFNVSSLYNFYNGSQFQIAPLIGESYFFLGAIFSPLIPAIMTNLAVRYGKKAELEENVWKYIAYVYLTLLLSMSMILYNVTIFLKTFTSLILPILILSKYSIYKKVGYKNKAEII